MNFRHVWIVFEKEVIDNIRDRRSLFLALIYPFIGALLLGLLISLVGGMFKSKQAAGDIKVAKVIAVEGAEYAPAIVAHLEKSNYKVVPPPADMAKALRQGKFDLVLRIKPDFAKKLRQEKGTKIELMVNATRLGTIITVSQVTAVLRQFAKSVGQKRLQKRGVDPKLAVPFTVEWINVGRNRNLAGFFLNMLPPFLIFTIFVGGVYLAIDTTAGERERGSLEPLLTNPVPRGQLMLGKAFATFLFTLVAVVFQISAFKGMFEIVTLLDKGIIINPEVSDFIGVFILCLPLILFAVSIQIIVATVSRSYKETQTYLALLPLIPSVPGMVLVFVPINAAPWMLAIPTFGQTVLIGKLMRQEEVATYDVLVTMIATTLVASVLLYFASLLYKREQLIFTG